MFGINSKKKANKKSNDEMVTAIESLFGDQAKAEGFDLEAAVKKTIGLAGLATKAATAFGDTANSEEFDFVASVKTAVQNAKVATKAANALAEIKALFGDDAKAEGFDMKTAVKEKIDRVAELEGMDGAEATNPATKLPTEADKILKKFRTSADDELDAMIAQQS